MPANAAECALPHPGEHDSDPVRRLPGASYESTLDVVVALPGSCSRAAIVAELARMDRVRNRHARRVAGSRA